jgi:DNA-binding transcriptional LysR family regulator
MNPSVVQHALVSRLKFKHLDLLVALDDTRNLHQAAVKVNVAQASASRMLSEIEDAFGFLLFIRNSRGMQPTSLGTDILSYARRSLSELTRFAAELEIQTRGGYDQLTVVTIMGAAFDVLALAVSEMKTKRPMLHVRILDERIDQVVQLLQRHEVDLALGRLTEPFSHKDLEFEPLARETMRIVARASHPLSSARAVSLDELMSWPWILQPITSMARNLFEGELAIAGLTTPVNVVECGSIFATFQLLQNSDAVTMLLKSVARDYLRAHLIVELPLEIRNSLTSFGVLRRKDQPLCEPAEYLFTLLRKYTVRPSS